MKTLKDLLDAIVSGKASGVVAMLDNDNVSFYSGEEHLLDLHPYEVQEQALAALGITAEAV